MFADRRSRVGRIDGETGAFVGKPDPAPMVGRQAELDLVVAALASGAVGVVLAGPAGVGKTRLAREVVQRLGD